MVTCMISQRERNCAACLDEHSPFCGETGGLVSLFPVHFIIVATNALLHNCSEVKDKVDLLVLRGGSSAHTDTHAYTHAHKHTPTPCTFSCMDEDMPVT